MTTVSLPSSGRSTLWLLRLLSAAMLLLSASLLAWNLLWPQAFEQAAAGVMQQRIVAKIGNRIRETRAYALKEKAKGLLDRIGVDADRLEAQLVEQAPQWVARAFDQLCGYDCEQRKLAAGRYAGERLQALQQLKFGRNTVGEIVRAHYLQFVADLRLRLRIGLAVVAGLSLLLLLSASRKVAPDRSLLLASGLLLLTVLAMTAIWLQARSSLYRALFDGGWDWLFAGIACVVAVLLLVSLGRKPQLVV